MIGIIAYFVRDILGQFKEHRKSSDTQHLDFSKELGKLEGKIEMVEKQAINDITRIEQLTQLKLEQISKDVSDLTKAVQQLITQKA
jgi:hypothetical protein